MLKLITLLLASSMTVMAGSTLAPALPQIQRFFQDVPDASFWVKLMLTMPGLFTALSAPVSGILVDRLGRKPLLLAATLLYGFAGGAGLVLSSISGLLVSRAVLGVAVGAIMTSSTTLIADYYQGTQRNQVMGVQAAFVSFGGVAFLILGGVLADVGWRFPFLIYLMAFVVFGLVLVAITEPRQKPSSQVALQETASPAHAPVAGLAVIYLLVFGTMTAFYLVPVQLPFYLQGLSQGPTSNTSTGIAIGLMNLTSALVSTRYRAVKSRLSFPAIMGVGFLGMALGYGIIAQASTYTWVVVGLAAAGLGLGLLIPNVNVWVNAIAPPTLRGRAVGGLTTCLFLGQFASPILTQPLQPLGLARTYGVVGAGVGVLAVVMLGFSAKQKSQRAL
ncbi:MFS transporter [Pseudanabaena sp. FACHB-2040]|uniref:MFS transporter n=1 Tax=Pseudanabaena sp. FACHB-2040 TaxID=2692859 RepID=UPI0016884E3E|nr:MFS transporter [Pseudanabaena sp. FACHB-2040]MBD2255963.1 MFS transporter [Pseudanabaena sp. FACHB-2040]